MRDSINRCMEELQARPAPSQHEHHAVGGAREMRAVVDVATALAVLPERVRDVADRIQERRHRHAARMIHIHGSSMIEANNTADTPPDAPRLL